MSTGGTTLADFETELEAERLRWLRRRMIWYSGVVGLLALAALLMLGLVVVRDDVAPYIIPLEVVHTGLQLNICAVLLLYIWRRPTDRLQLLRIVYWIIVIFAAMEAVFSRSALEIELAWERDNASVVQNAEAASLQQTLLNSPIRRLMGAGTLLGAHLLACAFLPLTPREALRPIIPIMVISLAATLPFSDFSFPTVASAMFAPAAVLPGVALCWYRYQRFRTEFGLTLASGRYAQIRQELTNARRIHEMIFPPPINDGAFRVAWLYQPTRELGGDFLFTHPGDGHLNVVMIDVTGHGVAAALTVNRLHGELERLFAERPEMQPGECLAALNRYVNLTLLRQGIYATAVCLRVDGEAIHYANAGQPSPVLYGRQRVKVLEVTAPLLGAVPSDFFDADEKSEPWTPGDRLIAFTDGLTEARDQHGKVMGLDTLIEQTRHALLMAAAPDVVMQTFLDRVADYREGQSEDDMLLVHIEHATAVRAGDGSPPDAQPELA